MKKYLFGLGAMLVGAGLMFVLMHGEVSADNKDADEFTCLGLDLIKMETLPIAGVSVCTGHGLKCLFSVGIGEKGMSGVSCVKAGIFK